MKVYNLHYSKFYHKSISIVFFKKRDEFVSKTKTLKSMTNNLQQCSVKADIKFSEIISAGLPSIW